MAFLRPELERAIEDLKGILKQNEDTRKEIENLRDQLFSGCSIKESRRSIDQGDNIRILTMLSVLFLPLSFVTVSCFLLLHRRLLREAERAFPN